MDEEAMRSPAPIWLLIVGGVAAACGRAPDQSDASVPADTSTGVDSIAVGAGDSAAEDHAAHYAPGEPAPLLVIMRQLNTEMLALTAALMLDDRERVVSSAAAIANHAPIAQEDLDRISRELGPEMADFERIDEEVHMASMELSERAVSGQMYEVIDQLAEVQRGCIACHTLYRTVLTPSRRQ